MYIILLYKSYLNCVFPHAIDNILQVFATAYESQSSACDIWKEPEKSLTATMEVLLLNHWPLGDLTTVSN